MSFIVDAITRVPGGKTGARRIGRYLTHDEAQAAAKRVVDAFLFREFRAGAGHGITAQKLLAEYRRRGEKPVILRDSDTTTFASGFDPLAYAAQRCSELCEDKTNHKT